MVTSLLKPKDLLVLFFLYILFISNFSSKLNESTIYPVMIPVIKLIIDIITYALKSLTISKNALSPILEIKLATMVPKLTFCLTNNGIKTILPPHPGKTPITEPIRG